MKVVYRTWGEGIWFQLDIYLSVFMRIDSGFFLTCREFANLQESARNFPEKLRKTPGKVEERDEPSIFQNPINHKILETDIWPFSCLQKLLKDIPDQSYDG